MATDLSVDLDNRPGTLAALGEATGRAGVNLAGICGVATGGGATIHLLVEDDPAGLRSALDAAGITVVGERDVVVADVDDRPGAVGDVARRVADAGINIDLIYLATRTRLVLGTDDPAGTRAVLA